MSSRMIPKKKKTKKVQKKEPERYFKLTKQQEEELRKDREIMLKQAAPLALTNVLKG